MACLEKMEMLHRPVTRLRWLAAIAYADIKRATDSLAAERGVEKIMARYRSCRRRQGGDAT